MSISEFCTIPSTLQGHIIIIQAHLSSLQRQLGSIFVHPVNLLIYSEKNDFSDAVKMPVEKIVKVWYSHTIFISNRRLCQALEPELFFQTNMEGKAQSMKNEKLIFISHSTRDRALAEIIVDLAAACGISKDIIFCSSYRGADVRQQIPSEIKEALKTSKLDIVILSNDYKKSTYCLNEAGVIWYKNDNYKLTVTLPEIFDELSAGFISTDYIQYRLEDKKFSEYFFGTFTSALYDLGIMGKSDDFSIIQKIQKNFSKQINRYIRHLPVTANLSTDSRKAGMESAARSEVKMAQSNIRKMFNCSCMQHQQPLIFYEHYIRCIELKAIEPGKMAVKTTTEYTVANLSDKPHTELFSSQFLRRDGGFDTYSDGFWIDGKKISFGQNSSTPNNCPYIIYSGPEIIIKPHKIVKVEYVTSYQIAPERFFQSKLVKIPCGKYKIRANFDKDFMNVMKQDYIFRFQVIPCVPHNLSYGAVPISNCAETEDKHFVDYSVENGFPAGGGYVIVINKNQ